MFVLNKESNLHSFSYSWIVNFTGLVITTAKLTLFLDVYSDMVLTVSYKWTNKYKQKCDKEHIYLSTIYHD